MKRASVTALVATGFAALSIGTAVAAEPNASSGFYVRADVGGSLGQTVSIPGQSASGITLNAGSGTIGGSVLLGAGVGYRINPMFRIDATLGYLPSAQVSVSGTGLVGARSLTYASSATANAWVGLVNGYFDISGLSPQSFGAFQPYVSAGFGFANINLASGSGTVNVAGLGTTPFPTSNATATNFAWSVGAGVGYTLTPQATLDLSYKYLNVGSSSAIKNQTLNLFALGVRYTF